jgi:hypothetical protein
MDHYDVEPEVPAARIVTYAHVRRMRSLGMPGTPTIGEPVLYEDFFRESVVHSTRRHR